MFVIAFLRFATVINDVLKTNRNDEFDENSSKHKQIPYAFNQKEQ